ncbi:MAG: serine protease [Terriglobia bacterium]|jgi:ClpP class serine protease
MWQERKTLIDQIQKKRNSRLICYLTSDRQNAGAIIAKDALPVFFNQLRALGRVDRLDILVFTAGGDTLAAFGLGRLVREFADWTGVLIPDRCLSAGTLFALGANEIFMTRAGTLSPIDPSITTPLNPYAEGPMPGQRQLLPVSVESVAGFRSLLQEEWSVKSEEMTAEVFKTLAEKVHPLALGDVYRSRQQIERLAHQLLTRHRDDDMQVQTIIKTLTRGLGSHDYPISLTEARELLGGQIAVEDPELEGLVWDLYEDFRKELQLGVPFNPSVVLTEARTKNQRPPIRVQLDLAVVESERSRDVFQQDLFVSEATLPTPAGPVKAPQLEILSAGWNHYDQ